MRDNCKRSRPKILPLDLLSRRKSSGSQHHSLFQSVSIPNPDQMKLTGRCRAVFANSLLFSCALFTSLLVNVPFFSSLNVRKPSLHPSPDLKRWDSLPSLHSADPLIGEVGSFASQYNPLLKHISCSSKSKGFHVQYPRNSGQIDTPLVQSLCM
jgi:hypothetical protein